MCLRIPFYIYFQSGRLIFVKKVKIIVPYWLTLAPIDHSLISEVKI